MTRLPLLLNQISFVGFLLFGQLFQCIIGADDDVAHHPLQQQQQQQQQRERKILKVDDVDVNDDIHYCEKSGSSTCYNTLTETNQSCSSILNVEDGEEEDTEESSTLLSSPSSSVVEVECGVWLAPSSIPGAGLGIFAGRDFVEGEALLPSGDIAVPEIDIYQHQFQRDNFIHLWSEYTWSGNTLNCDNEGLVDVRVESPGFGAAANYFVDLINVAEGAPSNTMPHSLHRSKDPGAGAFTTYHNRESFATVSIQKGEELFVDYGQKWVIDRPFLGPIPLKGDLKNATQLFQQFRELHERHPNVSSLIFDELWITFLQETEFYNSRILGAFRQTREEWLGLWYGMTLKEIRIQEGRRTPEWLQEHGTCADNMKEGLSTIRQAGRGAFATRHLANGSVVAPLPLIHVSNRSVFEMLLFEDIRSLKTNGTRMGEQLPVNYCFGHNESTLLLCPYGPLTGLVNHNQTLTNVKIRWSEPSKGIHQAELLERPIGHFESDLTAKLAMEMVATRDIMVGEEIFLDYGDEWEDAWKKHVQNWKPIPLSKNYISSHQLNSSPDRLRTKFEQMQVSYPGHIDLMCDFTFLKNMVVTKKLPSAWTKCEVLHFSEINGTHRYTAAAANPEDSKMFSDAPREAFKFVDRPYTSDMFLPNAFRHPMMIPDHIFPDYWRNLKGGA